LNNIEQRFSNNLKNVIWPTEEQKEKEHWNVAGILKTNSNQEFKFDVRSMFAMPNNQLGKKATTASKANKIVFETEVDWVVIDTEELHTYIRTNKLNTVQFEDLLNKLEWTIVLPKK
jgi:hypothetical protein